MTSEAVNHDPALTFLQTGAQLPGRPSIGAWLDYGLGSENADLPAFITLISKRPVDQPLSSRLWDAGFLPTRHQGVQFRAGADPVLYLRDPKGLSRDHTRGMIDALNELHRLELARSGQPDLEGKIAQYEMAYRMQMAVPEVTDLSKEPESVKSLYGPDVAKPGSFAANCLLARRLAESGVRFIQLFHPGWDHHGSLPEGFVVGAQEVDQPAAGLLADLAARDLLQRHSRRLRQRVRPHVLLSGENLQGHRLVRPRAPPRLFHLLAGRRWCETGHDLWRQRRLRLPTRSKTRFTSTISTPLCSTSWASITSDLPIASKDVIFG